MKRSCASCLQPAKYFTDALPKSIAFDESSASPRNAPALLYAGYQYTQFWDGRVKSLEEQIRDVIASPVEMNADFELVLKRLRQNQKYVKSFKEVFYGKKDSLISVNNVTHSIAALYPYIKTNEFIL